jgi:hypothetical protein
VGTTNFCLKNRFVFVVNFCLDSFQVVVDAADENHIKPSPIVSESPLIVSKRAREVNSLEEGFTTR